MMSNLNDFHNEESFELAAEYRSASDINYGSRTKDNKKVKKTKRLSMKKTYGLRPRNQMRRPSYEDPEGGGGVDTESAVPKKKEPRSKKNSLATRFRRLTANARERQRMKEINTAFNTLQSILPALNCRPKPSSAASKSSMTKIRTLRQAASYIQSLSELLSSGNNTDNSTLHITESETFKQLDNICLNVCVTTSYELHTSPALPLTTSRNPVISTDPTFCLSYQNHPNNQNSSPNHSTVAYKSPYSVIHKNEPFSEFPSNDEELFSLLEKEVLNIRNGEVFSESCTHVGELNWNDDFVSLGCN